MDRDDEPFYNAVKPIPRWESRREIVGEDSLLLLLKIEREREIPCNAIFTSKGSYDFEGGKEAWNLRSSVIAVAAAWFIIGWFICRESEGGGLDFEQTVREIGVIDRV